MNPTISDVFINEAERVPRSESLSPKHSFPNVTVRLKSTGERITHVLRKEPGVFKIWVPGEKASREVKSSEEVTVE